jgi:peptide/nickel transport system permease protein
MSQAEAQGLAAQETAGYPRAAAGRRPAWRRLLPASFEGKVGAVLVVFVILMAIFGPYVAPQNPAAIHFGAILVPPSAAHPFGTDEVGRDLLSRVLAGARYTITAAVIVIATSVVIGSLIGGLAGYVGGWLGNALMRLTDLFLSYPSMLLAIAVAAALGPGLTQSCLALITGVWATYARLAQVQAVSIRNREFVQAAETIGMSRKRIVLRHVVPNALSPVLVRATMDVAFAVEWIAGLGFVGLGAQPPTPEWGTMIAESREYALTAWWYVAFPGLALVITVIGFTLLGTALDAQLFGRGQRGSRLSRRELRRLRPDTATAGAATLSGERAEARD